MTKALLKNTAGKQPLNNGVHVPPSSVSDHVRPPSWTPKAMLAAAARDARFVADLISQLSSGLRRRGVPVGYVTMRVLAEMHEARLEQLTRSRREVVGRQATTQACLEHDDFLNRGIKSVNAHFHTVGFESDS